MKDDKAQLRQRCGEWARRRGLGNMDTGFLDGTTGRDIVDCYELWVGAARYCSPRHRMPRLTLVCESNGIL
jgi:hypothetical protein